MMLYSVHLLRFIASFAVVFWHGTSYYVQTFKVGAAGVDLFFVISGIVIGLSTRDGYSSRDFILKRFIRVIPMYWLATLLYMGFRYWAWKSLPSDDLFLRSIALIPRSGENWSPIYWPAWSICYEIFFYATMAVILITVTRNTSQICAMLVTFVAITRIPVPWDFSKYFQSDWGLEFVAGLIISISIKNRMRVNRQVGVTCLILSVTMFFLNSGENALPRIIVWGVPSVVAVIGMLSLEGSEWLKHRWVRLGGDMSYSVYLTHISVIEYLRELGAHYSIDVNANPIVFVGGPVIATLVVGAVVNRYVERPMLDALRRWLIPKRSGASDFIENQAANVRSYAA